MNKRANAILLGALFFGLIVFPSLSANAQSPGNRPMQNGAGTSQPGMPGQDGTDPNANMQQQMADHNFVIDAAEGGLAEVELGQLATEKASNASVKQFGQRMVDDHSKANDQLKQIALAKGIKVPSSLSGKDAKTKDRLSKLSGADFDRAYMKLMVKDHEKDVSDFRQESTSGQDPAIRKFAAETLPTLQSHLKQAESIAPHGNLSAATTPTGAQ